MEGRRMTAYCPHENVTFVIDEPLVVKVRCDNCQHMLRWAMCGPIGPYDWKMYAWGKPIFYRRGVRRNIKILRMGDWL